MSNMKLPEGVLRDLFMSAQNKTTTQTWAEIEAAIRADERAKTIEECAMVVGDYCATPGFPDGRSPAFRKHRSRMAAAIRALKGGKDE